MLLLEYGVITGQHWFCEPKGLHPCCIFFFLNGLGGNETQPSSRQFGITLQLSFPYKLHVLNFHSYPFGIPWIFSWGINIRRPDCTNAYYKTMLSKFVYLILPQHERLGDMSNFFAAGFSKSTCFSLVVLNQSLSLPLSGMSSLHGNASGVIECW